MLNILRVSVTFLDPAPSFHGRADADQPEWPPSPLRLFQALVAAAASRWQRERFKESAQPVLAWLQRQDAPTIVAPRHHVSVPFRIAVPNNDMDVPGSYWAKRQEPSKPHRPVDLKTMKTVGSSRMCLADIPQGSHIHYLFPLGNGDCPDLETLTVAARSITHLGWGVDMVAADVSVLSERESVALPGEYWRPVSDSSPVVLRTPIDGTLDALIATHQAFLSRISVDSKGDESYSPVPSLSVFRMVGYRRHGDPAQRPSEVFELQRDGTLFSYPQDRLIHIAGMVRHLAIEAMGRSRPGDVDKDWVKTYVAGHARAGGTEHRQLSYLPMPSIGHAQTDQSVRRVMIAAPLGDDQVLRDLAMLLGGQPLKPTPETKLDHPPTLVRVQGDKVARLYTQPANAWASVTPLILPVHDDHKPDKARKLIEKALAQAGIDQQCEFESSSLSHFPKSLSAHKYGRDKRPTGYIRPNHLLTQSAVHLKLRFKGGLEVPGPLVIGAGRHCGFGLMAGVDR